MARIHLLQEEVFRKIAAGEVIERPLSVVKELVENSLDAGAGLIRVFVEKGGKEMIRVEDDGHGFAAAEVELAFQSHSTSKLTELSDLDRLATLGFRGEALPSILEVAQVELKTADNDEGRGVRLLFRDGRLAEKGEIAFSQGSWLEVRRLFYNFPVRRKFLKSDAGELNQVVRFLEQAALANPGVAFEFQSGGRSLFHYPAVATLADRVYQVFGREFLDDLQVVDFDRSPYRIGGMVSRPGRGLAARNCQFFFVNRRPVREKTLIAATNNSCAPFLEKGSSAAAILRLDVPPAEIDVNIHPMKLEIRFRDSGRIYSLVKDALESALIHGGALPPGPGVETAAAPLPFTPTRYATGHAAGPEPGPLLTLADQAGPEGFRVLGQYRYSYIVVEKEGELLLVDQHNARERVLYERLREQNQEGEVAAAATLFPVVVELTPAERELLDDERLAMLKRSGFEIGDLGGTAVEIRTFPQLLDERRIKETFRALLGLEADSWSQMDKLLAGIACKAAVKVNQPLTAEEMRRIVSDLFATPNPRLCPHQRPTFVSFSLADIEKLLKRR